VNLKRWAMSARPLCPLPRRGHRRGSLPRLPGPRFSWSLASSVSFGWPPSRKDLVACTASGSSPAAWRGYHHAWRMSSRPTILSTWHHSSPVWSPALDRWTIPSVRNAPERPLMNASAGGLDGCPAQGYAIEVGGTCTPARSCSRMNVEGLTPRHFTSGTRSSDLLVDAANVAYNPCEWVMPRTCWDDRIGPSCAYATLRCGRSTRDRFMSA